MFNIFRKKNCSNTKHFSQAYKLIKIQGKLVEFLRCISFYRQVKIYVSLKLTPYISPPLKYSPSSPKKTNHRHYFKKVEAEKLGVKPCFCIFPFFLFFFFSFYILFTNISLSRLTLFWHACI